MAIPSLDLVLDTSRKGIVLGIFNSEGALLLERHLPAAKGEQLDSLIVETFGTVNCDLSDLRRVLVTLGPGTFTGLRTGIAFCEGLCITGRRTLHGISTLRALACWAPHASLCEATLWPANVAVVYKARPDYWYLGCSQGEFFLSSEEVCTLLAGVEHVVADTDAFNAAAFASFDKSGWITDRPDSVAPFHALLASAPAEPSQKANYIQDSYFEKKR